MLERRRTTNEDLMAHHPRKRFWLEAGLLGLSVAAVVVSLVSRAWLEKLLGVDPRSRQRRTRADDLPSALLCTALCLGGLVQREWRRAASAAG